MKHQMNMRRTLLAAAGAGTLMAPIASLAQQPGKAPGKVWRVGFLALTDRAATLDPDVYGAFAPGMRDLGYVEGRNLLIEWRFGEGDSKRLPALAAELAQLKPDALVGAGTNAALALQKATSVIPIVTATSTDPVASGLIKSLAHQGGNVTGILGLAGELGPKRLEMLRAMVPKLSTVAVLTNPASATSTSALEAAVNAGRQLGIRIVPVEAGTPQEIDGAFAHMRKHNAGALVVVLNGLFMQQTERITALAAKHRLPSIAAVRSFAEAGGLMSYGSNLGSNYRRLAVYMDKIFKGAKPADLPVEQPTRFELVINGKTAKALGLKIPQSLLISADKVIE